MAFALVQNMPDVGISSGSNVVTSTTFTNPVTSGNMVVGVVYMISGDVANTVTVVDNNAVAQNPINLGRDTVFTGDVFSMFWKLTGAGGPTSYTATCAGPTPVGMRIWVEEWSGFSAGAAIDVSSGGLVNNTTGANSMFTPSVSSTSSGDFIWSFALDLTLGGAPLTHGTSPAFTINLNNGNPTPVGLYTEYFTQVAAGSIQATWQATSATSGSFLGMMALTQIAAATAVPFSFLRAPLTTIGVGAGAYQLQRIFKDPTCSRRRLLTGGDDR